MNSWHYLSSITLTLLTSSLILVFSYTFLTEARAINDSIEENSIRSNTFVEDYNNTLEKKFRNDSILLPIEIATLVGDYDVENYEIQMHQAPSTVINYTVNVLGVAVPNSYLDPQVHLAELEAYPGEFYTKYKIRYDIIDGKVTNLKFIGYER